MQPQYSGYPCVSQPMESQRTSMRNKLHAAADRSGQAASTLRQNDPFSRIHQELGQVGYRTEELVDSGSGRQSVPSTAKAEGLYPCLGGEWPLQTAERSRTSKVAKNQEISGLGVSRCFRSRSARLLCCLRALANVFLALCVRNPYSSFAILSAIPSLQGMPREIPPPCLDRLRPGPFS